VILKILIIKINNFACITRIQVLVIITKNVFLPATRDNLRRYLDGLATAENIMKYVEQHPFGQERITETSESWDFYLNVINSLSVCQPEK